MVVVASQVVLLLETWKSAEGALIVIVPGAPVRFVPDILKDCEAEFVDINTLPKSTTVPAVNEGEGGNPVQINTGEALFRGAGVATVKSAPLLSVSSQPLLFLIPPVVGVKTAVAAVSKQLDDPYPTKSITPAEGKGQADKAVSPFTKASLPLVPLIAIVGFET